ncbi:MAG: pyrimidine 5'-nucleotidase [Anaerolineales bacterium]|nr:pyrimidine 5'-nucleotidase [Anaerolineales bacterium]
MIRTIFFDLDDTLYPKDSGVWQAMRARIGAYMQQVVGIPAAEAAQVREGYLKKYGTTLRGLQHDFAIDADDYLRYVHDVPIESLIAPNPALAAMLAALPQEKFIFTNSVSFHAERVLAALGVQAAFAGIIDVRAMEFRSKPDPFAYQVALARGQVAAPAALFVDDMPANLRPAHALGAQTALLGTLAEPDPAVSVCIARPEQLIEAMPALVEFAHE